MAKVMGFQSQFLCVQIEKPCGSREFVATREYFPSNFYASIRQKSRWTLGIAYQGLQKYSMAGQWDRSLFFSCAIVRAWSTVC